MPDSQFCVSRTVNKDKDSSSYYQIGNKRCKTKDVTKLLMEKGIDLNHNRFLILQVGCTISHSHILTISPYHLHPHPHPHLPSPRARWSRSP